MSYQKLRNLSLEYRKIQEKNKDVYNIVTGKKGDGKSNFSILSAFDYLKNFGLICKDCKHEWVYTKQAINLDENGIIRQVKREIFQPCPKCNSQNIGRIKQFNFKKYLAYTADELMDIIENERLPSFSPIVGDEAVEWLFSEEWNKTQNKRIKKIFMKIRTKRYIIFGCVPEFVTIDSKHKNMANFWIRFMQRTNNYSVALVVRSNKAEVEDKWMLKDIQKGMKDYFEDTSIHEIMELCEKLKGKVSTVLDWILVPPLPEKLYNEYESYRNEKVWEKNEEELILTKKELGAIILYNIYHNWKEFFQAVINHKFKKPTYKMLEKFLCVNPQTNIPFVKIAIIQRWVQDIEERVKRKRFS